MWYQYAGASARGLTTSRQPITMARVLEGGGTQLTEMTYNSSGMITSKTDPAGRETTYTYDTNGIDLLQVEQTRSGGTDVLQVYDDYTSQHLPESITDAAGQETTMTYNAAGQPLTVTNAKSETTTYEMRTFREEYTESDQFLEQQFTKFTAPSGMLGDMSGLACLNFGPPR